MTGRPRRSALPALLAASLLASPACGHHSASRGSSAPVHVAKIAVLAPLSGVLSPQGIGIRDAVDLAITEANQRNAVPGWQLQMVATDDAANAEEGALAASDISSDPGVVGVVGPLNSSVAQEVLPILDWAGIATISPGTTADALTRGRDSVQPARSYPSFFRVCTIDSLQGAFAADYAFHAVGARTVAVIHDKKTYGAGIAADFSDRFLHDGGRVVSTQEINAGDKDFSTVLRPLVAVRPDLIFYGGEFPEAALISEQSKQLGVGAPVLGGDGIKDGSYISIAGPSSQGDLATSIGAPPEALPQAASFISDYNRAGYPDSYSSYGAFAFDAANVIIAAMAKALPGRSTVDRPARQAIIKAVGATNLDGVTGHIAFDSFGDSMTKLLTMYQVVNGAFVPKETANLAG